MVPLCGRAALRQGAERHLVLLAVAGPRGVDEPTVRVVAWGGGAGGG